MPRHRSSTINWLTAASGIALSNLALAPFLLGGSRAPFEAGFACCLWLAFACFLLHVSRGHQTRISIPLGMPLFAVTAVSLLGLIPWPASLYARFDEERYGLLGYLNQLLSSESIATVPYRISLEPALTAQGSLRLVGCIFMATILLRFFQKKPRRILFSGSARSSPWAFFRCPPPSNILFG